VSRRIAGALRGGRPFPAHTLRQDFSLTDIDAMSDDQVWKTFMKLRWGTKFADHKLPLRRLLKAVVLYITAVNGISASQLARTLGVAYMTALGRKKRLSLRLPALTLGGAVDCTIGAGARCTQALACRDG